jgi:hypothetical protein
VHRIDRSAVGYALLFALPAGIATASLVDALAPTGVDYTVAAGVGGALCVFLFVLVLATTGSPDESRGSEIS